MVLKILHNFIQQSLNSGSTQVQVLLTACQRFVKVGIWQWSQLEIRPITFRWSTILQNQFFNHHHLSIVPLPAHINPLPSNRLANKLDFMCLKIYSRNPPFCSLASFSILSQTPFINKSDSSRDLSIFIISFIHSFEIISVVICDQKNVFWIVVTVADTAAINCNGIRACEANSVSTFFKNTTPILTKDYLR